MSSTILPTSKSTIFVHSSLPFQHQTPTATSLNFPMSHANFPLSSSSSSLNFKSPNITKNLPLFSCHASLKDEELPIHGVSEKIVGVLGGGQLGRMLCQAASEMAIKVAILDPSENCPASSLSYYHMVGNFNDSATVEEFAKRCGVLTVEIEHVDVVTLEKLEQQGVDCQPKASTIRIIQDKFLQKVHFSQTGIPLAEFMEIEDLESTRRAGELFGYPLMIKSKRLAYDGRGNAVAKCEEDLSSAVSALGGYERGLYIENGLHLLRSWLSLWQEEETILLCATLLLKLYTNIKKQRKMGHITITGISMSIVEAQLKTLLTGEKLEDAAFPRVGIIMGSDSDLPVMKEASRILNLFGVSHEVRIVSAHRTPEMMFSYAKSARERGVQVVIAGAGGAAHLPGMVAALTPVPVIGVPVRSSSLDGLDSLLSIVQVYLEVYLLLRLQSIMQQMPGFLQ